MLANNDLRPNPAAAQVFAWLSAPGVAALSLLFIAADDAGVFRGDLAKVTNLPRRFWLRDALGNPLDEVMACRERGGILLTCHGGPAVRRALEAELTRAGFVSAAPAPFGRTPFETATLGLLPDARGEGAVGLLLEAAGQGRSLAELLDSPGRIAPLLAVSASARFLLEPPRVQLWGPVNAGKSSLMNAILGVNRAIVTEIPGTTRDYLEESVHLDGLPVRLVDTAGLRAAGDEVELLGMERTRELMRRADLVLLVIDADLGPGAEDLDLAAEVPDLVIVANKMDLLAGCPAWFGEEPWKGKVLCPIAAKFGQGVQELLATVRAQVAGGNAPGPDAPVPNLRQHDALQRAARELEAMLGELENGLPYDLLSVRLDTACAVLGEITGEMASEDVLNAVFDRFCIGK